MVIRQVERCSGSTEEEMPATVQSKYGDRLHRVMTSWLGVKAAREMRWVGMRWAGLDLLLPG